MFSLLAVQWISSQNFEENILSLMTYILCYPEPKISYMFSVLTKLHLKIEYRYSALLPIAIQSTLKEGMNIIMVL